MSSSGKPKNSSKATHKVGIREELFARNTLLIEGVDETFLSDVIIPFQKLSANNNVEFIKLIIDSPGGSVIEMFQLITMIRKCEKPVIAEVLSAFSAGFLIASQCHHRIAYEGSLLMYHCPWTVAVGNTEEIDAQTKYMREMTTRSEELVLERSKIEPDKLAEYRTTDWWMTAREARKVGIIDEIISDDVYAMDPDDVQDEIKQHRKAQLQLQKKMSKA